MKVHLIRSNELSIETYSNVWNLLNKIQGPIDYIIPKDADWEVINYEKDWISEEQFKKAEYEAFESERCMSKISPTRSSFSSLFEEFPPKEPQATWDDLFSICEQYRIENSIPETDLVFLLTDVSNEKNWFGAVDKKMGNFFVQTSNWSTFFGSEIDARFPIAYEVVVWILRIMMYNNRHELSQQMHMQPKGCMMDFCEHKSQIVLKMRTADVCGDCLDQIQKIVWARWSDGGSGGGGRSSSGGNIGRGGDPCAYFGSDSVSAHHHRSATTASAHARSRGRGGRGGLAARPTGQPERRPVRHLVAYHGNVAGW